MSFHAGVLGAALILAPSVGWSQTDAIDNVVPATSTTLALGAAVAAIPVLVTTSVIGSGPPADELEAYLRRNRVGIAQDVSLGSGQTVEDLAGMFGVARGDVPAFGRELRARRRALMEHARGPEGGGAAEFAAEVSRCAARAAGEV